MNRTMNIRACPTFCSSLFLSFSRCWSAALPRARALLRVWPAFVLLLALAGCGDLPRPFQGNPGATAMRLAQPPPARLAVVAITDSSLMPEASGLTFTDSLAAGLQALEVPAFAGRVQQGDWKLTARAEQRGDSVVRAFLVQDATGKDRGATEGVPVPAASWTRADPTTLREAAASDVPAIADLLSRIQGTEQRADPNSLFNRPARVWIGTMQGAPGDGNQSLILQLRKELGKLGPLVQDKPDAADFTINGQVRTTPLAGGMQRIEIQWLVLNSTGREVGNITQGNDIPAGTLNGYWGDVAVVVAKEASGGVRDVILTQSGRRQSKPAEPPNPTGPPNPAGPPPSGGPAGPAAKPSS